MAKLPAEPKERKERDVAGHLIIPPATEYEIREIPKERDPNRRLDPLNINPRLASWISELIESRHQMNVSEQVRAVAAIARIQYLFMKLREETEKEKNEQSTAANGSEVKRFAKAFEVNATRRRKKIARHRDDDDVIAAIEHQEDSDELEY